MDLSAVRAALAQQVQAYTGLRTHPAAPGSVSPPCAVVLPGSPLAAYGRSTDGAVDLGLRVMILVSAAPAAEKAQQALDELLFGAASVPGAIESDPTMAGLVAWAEPVSVTSYGLVQWGAVDFWGASLAVTIGAR
jgi:hypothetical protein